MIFQFFDDNPKSSKILETVCAVLSHFKVIDLFTVFSKIYKYVEIFNQIIKNHDFMWP